MEELTFSRCRMLAGHGVLLFGEAGVVSLADHTQPDT